MNKIQSVPLFICGHHRSGTSLLNHLLDGHPELIVNGYESKFFPLFLPQASHAAEKERIELVWTTLLRVWDKHHEYYNKYLSDFDIDSIKNTFKEELSKTDKGIHDYLVASIMAYARVTGQYSLKKKYWVEKTPHSEYFTQDIFQNWPSAKCIHIFRDPRDLHATLRKRHGNVFSVRTTALNWKRSITAMKSNQALYGKDKYLIIKYEDFVSDPEKWILRIIDFLGIQNDPCLRTPTLAGGSVNWKGNTLKTSYSGISASSLGQWKEYFSKDRSEIDIIEYLLKDEMEALDYTISNSYQKPSKPKMFMYQMIMQLKRTRQRFRRFKKPVL